MPPPRLRPATILAGADARHPGPGRGGEHPHCQPIYQTAAYEAADAESLQAMATGQGYFYARYGDPNEDAVAQVLGRLEAGPDAEAPAEVALFASGMAAIEAALLATLSAGPRAVITASALYGATTGLLRELHGSGQLLLCEHPEIEAGQLARRIDELNRTGQAGVAAVYLEVMTNPLLRVADLPALSAVCAARGVPLIADATFTTPLLCRPLTLGATLVVHSATKYLGGHGDLCAGVVAGPRDGQLLSRIRQGRKLHGAVLDPFSAWLLHRGLKTLSVRLQRQVDNAEALAGFLCGEVPRLGLRQVIYPGLLQHPDHALATRLLDRPGALISFEVADGADARRVYDRVRVIRRVASLGDVDSLLLHPASSSHRGLSEEERVRMGITQGLLRLSVGIEDVEDLKEDLRAALS